MRLTRASSYAVQALIYLASQRADPLTAERAAVEAIDVPGSLLPKLLSRLAEAGILQWIKNDLHGRYQLVRSAKDITLLEIVEAVDGPMQANASDGGIGTRFRISQKLAKVCENVTEQIRQQLKRVTLADLMGKN